jgi:hypothetical protein
MISLHHSQIRKQYSQSFFSSLFTEIQKLNINRHQLSNVLCARGRPNFGIGFGFGAETAIKVSFGGVSFSAESRFKAFGGGSVTAETDFTVSAGAETVFTTRRTMRNAEVACYATAWPGS